MNDSAEPDPARTDARHRAELAARTSYGRLVASLAARTNDLGAAEDALSDAFLEALTTWPRTGIPARPEAWLLTVARRRLVDARRRARIGDAILRSLAVDASTPDQSAEVNIPDERLKLLFACAHPAIDDGSRTPLMLQAVLGLDAARIASAFLVAPSAMSQRLVRAKARIRDARIRFEVPDGPELAERLASVLDAVYVAFGSGWDDIAGSDPRRKGLAEEAIWLGRLLVELMPDEPEAAGLLALMLYCESRRPARRTRDGAYVPLADQDCALWSRPLIVDAEQVLARAARFGRHGRYQLEAAIQSSHVLRAVTGRTDWQSVALLYEGLARISPTIGVLVGRAAALAEALGAEAGLAALHQIPFDQVAAYQPYWALAGHLSIRLGRVEEAETTFDQAIGLSEDPAVRAYLLSRRPIGHRADH